MLQKVKIYIVKLFWNFKFRVWDYIISPLIDKEKDYVLIHVDEQFIPTSDEIIVQTELTKGEANFTNDFHKEMKTGMFYFSLKEYKKIFKSNKT